MKWMRVILACLLLNAVSACYSIPNGLKPAGFVFNHMPEDAPENFKKGWKDGCTTGASFMSNSFYRWFYRFTIDKEMINDPVYYATWKDTATYCRHYVYGIVKEGDGRTRTPTQNPAVLDRFAGVKDFFSSGALGGLYTSSGSGGLPFQNWGETKGQGFFSTDSVFNWDYSSDGAFTGHTQTFGHNSPLFFTPKHSIVPY